MVAASRTSRFDVLRPLGSGGMGIVYEAFDREQGVKVALKRLKASDPAQVLRLKNEFRSLRDITHPNLVTLGELVEEAGEWFFTMELVHGKNFLHFVRPVDAAGSGTTGTWTAGSNHSPETMRAAPDAPTGALNAPSVPVLPEGGAQGLEIDRLRGSLYQLVEGLTQLHRHGKIHRDVKPSNLLVDEQERLVILDFGLVRAIARGRKSMNEEVVEGTPIYMSPEQMVGGALGPATDWYAVGVLLYQALVGRPPWSGNFETLSNYKASFTPDPPHVLYPDVPQDFSELCASLLQADPLRRANREDILRLLDRRNGVRRRPGFETSSSPASLFVGREAELATLRGSLHRVEAGAARMVVIQGPSALGKSALVNRFTSRACAENPRLLVFAGRCHERESVPFKAFDGLVDELSRYLAGSPDETVRRLLPTGAGHLGRVFPALAGVPAIAEAASGIGEVSDVQELRQQVFDAFQQLLTRLSTEAPVTLVLDDLQWSDEDSRSLLAAILRSRTEGAKLLVLATVRTAETDPWSPTWLAELALGECLEHLPLQPLPENRARELAAILLDSSDAVSSTLLERISRESAGHPLFIHELVRHSRSSSEAASVLPPLDDAIWARVLRLPSAAQKLLELVAVAGSPLPNHVFASAANLDSDGFAKAMGHLRGEGLVRSHGLRRADGLEPYHDRIRETVSSRMGPAARKDKHQALATTLEVLDKPDVERLAIHWEGAGELAKALGHLATAAQQAEHTLAFDHAAGLYERCLQLTAQGAHSPVPRTELMRARAQALSNAGRGAEAADLYLTLSRDAQGPESVTLVRMAAERYLMSGHMAAGMPALERALAATGMRLDRRLWRKVLTLITTRVRLILRGLRFELRAAENVPSHMLQRTDVALSAYSALSFADSLVGLTFGMRALLFALDAGEPRRLCRALMLEYVPATLLGGKDGTRAKRLWAAAETLLATLKDPETDAFMRLHKAFALFICEGEITKAGELVEQAEQLMRDECRGMSWEAGVAMMISGSVLFHQGELRQMRTKTEKNVQAALRRGDFMSAANGLTGGSTISDLMDDAPDLARQHIQDVVGRWPGSPFLLVHFYEVFSSVHVDLYEKRGSAAITRVRKAIPDFKRAFFMQAPLIKYLVSEMLARAELHRAAASRGVTRKQALREAHKHVARIRRASVRLGPALSQLYAGTAFAIAGEQEKALHFFEEAEKGFVEQRVWMYARFAQYRRGELMGGQEGAALMTEVVTRLAAEGVKRPARFVSAFSPRPFESERENGEE